MDAGALIKEYLTLRDGRETLKQRYSTADERLKSRMNEIEGNLGEALKEANVESLASDLGTAYRTVQTRYWSGNWDLVKEFIRKHDALDLLERRIQQTNMKQWIEDAGGEVPEGLNVSSEYKVIVRRK